MTEKELLLVIEQAAAEKWTELNLAVNNLKKLPVEIAKISSLQSLNLSFNQLSELPAEIAQISSLQSLNLSGNQLSNLPVEITQISSLQFLNLSDNQLSELPAEIAQISSLQSLNLSFNQLSELPAEIGQLTSLESLDLSGNKLSELPAEIAQLSTLQFLYLGGNQLSKLPAEIAQRSSLQFLNITRNKLSKLPAEIRQLSSLQFLYLSGNQLSELPVEIRKLTKLEKLDLRGNPIPIPLEILGAKELWRQPGDVSEILDFYFREENPNETEPLYEAKLLIVGEGETGKTSLAKKIEDENYQLQPNEKSTEGIDVIQWKFTLLNGKKFRVNIWDFGGQEIYHQTHQFFLSKRSFYVLVADSRKENPNFYWWLKVVELLSENSPVLVIKNQKQDRDCEINEGELRGEFSNLKGFLATNLATNSGLAEIKKAIQDNISILPHVGDASPLSKKWVRVRFAIENDSRNFISREQYYQLCKTHHLTERKDMLRLSEFLHDLGICLHFQDDSTLKHYVILKPEWATTAVYKVLDNETIKKQNLGCFTQQELVNIWQDSQYSEMQDELLQLMMRFKLCYQIPNRPGNYIAPQLLEIEQPEYNWDNSNNLILRYEYDFMPKGIITRFIVETHPWIEQQQLVWRSGVVLNKDKTRAEIIESYNRREIKVRISGNHKKDLLTVVNHELEKIHRSYERLKCETLVPCNCKKCAGNENAYSYPLDVLHDFLKDGDYEIQCIKSRKMVDVRRLIEDVNLSPQPEEFQELKNNNTRFQQELDEAKESNLNISIQKQNQNFSQKTILVLTSSPTDETRLRFDKEVQKINQGLLRSQHREKFILKSQFAVSPDDLRRALLDFNPQIVHFCGHGSGENGLILEDDAGFAQLVSTQALANLFKRFATRGLECVLLNACYSEVQANAIVEHIDYVVGMNSAIRDDAAIKFAIGFYDELAAGYSYEDAYHAGCNAIELQGIPQEYIPEFKNRKKSSIKNL